MKILKTFAYAFLAGISISIGGTVFLSVENHVVGAMLFAIGLFVICTFRFNLFTGRVAYVFENNISYALELIPIWIGNLLGCFLTANAEILTRRGDILREKALELCQAKLDDNLLSIFILSFFCNILVFIAVDGFKNNEHELGKYISVFFGVMVFILCGFEHCVANMYYFSMAGVWNFKTLLYVLVMTLGNSCGGILIPLIRRWKFGSRAAA